MVMALSTGIIIFGISIGTFVLTLLLRKPQKKKADYYLMTWMLLVIIHLLFLGAGFRDLLGEALLITAIGNSFPVLHIFLISLYINKLYGNTSRRPLIVFTVIFFAYVMLFYVMGMLGYIKQQGLLIVFSSKAPFWTYTLTASFILIYLVLTIALFIKIKSYRFRLKALYSDEIRTNVDWLNYWLTSYLLASLLIIVSILLADIGIVVIELAFLIVCAVLSLQVFMVGQYGAARNFSFPQAGAQKKYTASGLKEGDKEQLKQRLIIYLEHDKPYRNPELSLVELAEAMELPAYQASQLINEMLESSFFDLINTYRIDEFKRRLIDPRYSHLTIFGIAMDSGFNSKSGFYKAFKKATGMSPSTYKKSIN